MASAWRRAAVKHVRGIASVNSAAARNGVGGKTAAWRWRSRKRNQLGMAAT